MNDGEAVLDGQRTATWSSIAELGGPVRQLGLLQASESSDEVGAWWRLGATCGRYPQPDEHHCHERQRCDDPQERAAEIHGPVI